LKSFPNLPYTVIVLFILSCTEDSLDLIDPDFFCNQSDTYVEIDKETCDNDPVSGRFNKVNGRIQSTVNTSLTTGVYITYGQSNSENSGELGYDVINEVYQFFNDTIYEYEDPSLGGTGSKGSVWGMVGDKLINNGVHDKVIFSMTGWGGKTLKELNSDCLYLYFVTQYHHLHKKFGKVDGILFHQGESNHKSLSGHQNYNKEFILFLQNLKRNGINSPLYLSQVSYCNNEIDDELLRIQNTLVKEINCVYKGPNTDLLIDSQYRLPDNCHFSMLGFEKFSDMWVESIINKSEN